MDVEMSDTPSPIVLDPNGDVTITLLYQNTAPNEVDDVSNDDDPNDDSSDDDSTDNESSNDDSSEENPSEENSSEDITRDPFQDFPMGESITDSANKYGKVMFKASQKHLVLASPRARMILEGGGLEANKIYPDGTRHWTFDLIFHPAAFQIVLQILHGLTKDIPRKLTLEELACVAAVVDDLHCEKTVLFFGGLWIESLPKTKYLREDLPKWILVSSTFRDSCLFRECTKRAIMVSTDLSSVEGLPVRPAMLESIEFHRTQTLDSILSVLTAALTGLIKAEDTPLDGSTVVQPCSFRCRSAMLCALTIGMHTMAWIPTTAGEKIDYASVSVQDALSHVSSLESPRVCASTQRRQSTSICSLYNLLKAPLEKVKDHVHGLELDFFIRD